MIKIQINKTNNKYSSLLVSGHSNYDEHGKDIVCAGVSAVVTGGLNALTIEDKNKISYRVKDGYVNVISKNYFKPGDIVEIISPHNEPISFVIPDIYDMDGNKLDASRHPEEMVKFKLDVEVSKYDMIRIKLA